MNRVSSLENLKTVLGKKGYGTIFCNRVKIFDKDIPNVYRCFKQGDASERVWIAKICQRKHMSSDPENTQEAEILSYLKKIGTASGQSHFRSTLAMIKDAGSPSSHPDFTEFRRILYPEDIFLCDATVNIPFIVMKEYSHNLKYRLILEERELKDNKDFMWHVFRQVTEALAFLHFGYDATTELGRKATQSGLEGWIPCTHGDVSDVNILVGDSGDNDLRTGFPNLRLSDFSEAKLHYAEDKRDDDYDDTIVAQHAKTDLKMFAEGVLKGLGLEDKEPEWYKHLIEGTYTSKELVTVGPVGEELGVYKGE